MRLPLEVFPVHEFTTRPHDFMSSIWRQQMPLFLMSFDWKTVTLLGCDMLPLGPWYATQLVSFSVRKVAESSLCRKTKLVWSLCLDPSTRTCWNASERNCIDSFCLADAEILLLFNSCAIKIIFYVQIYYLSWSYLEYPGVEEAWVYHKNLELAESMLRKL